MVVYCNKHLKYINTSRLDTRLFVAPFISQIFTFKWTWNDYTSTPWTI